MCVCVCVCVCVCEQVLVDVMRKTLVKAGDWVIRQGDRGDQFYIIEKGTFEVRVNQDKEVVTDPKDAGKRGQGMTGDRGHDKIKMGYS